MNFIKIFAYISIYPYTNFIKLNRAKLKKSIIKLYFLLTYQFPWISKSIAKILLKYWHPWKNFLLSYNIAYVFQLLK